jgi:hypothetical protein
VKNSPTLGTSNNYVASTLRKDFQVFFVNYIPNTPVGCTNVNSFELIMLKGNLAFPREPSHPRGLLRGASPPKKMVPFFRKNSQARQVRLDLSLRRIQAGHEQPSGKDARAGDSLHLREDTALLPRLWTSRPLVESNVPSSNLPRQRKTERRDKQNKNITSIHKMFRTSNCSLHGHTA